MPAEDPRERYIAEDSFSVFRRLPEREERIGGIVRSKVYLGKRSLEMKKKILAIALSLAMVAAFCACSSDTGTGGSAAGSSDEGSGTETTLYLSAAASMTESMDKVIAAYEKENPGVDIVATYDSSGTLQTQIESGAECDIFLSAAQTQMDALQEGGFVMDGTRKNLLENKCALVVAEGSDIASWDDFEAAIESAQSSDDLIFSMGNADVPVGQYTSEILKYLGLNEQEMVDKGIITYGSNVKDVTSKVSSGAADCGIVYATDAYSAGMTPVGYATAEMTGGQVIYPVAVMEHSENKEAAQKFVDYLSTDEAMAFFTEVGFTQVTE